MSHESSQDYFGDNKKEYGALPLLEIPNKRTAVLLGVAVTALCGVLAYNQVKDVQYLSNGVACEGTKNISTNIGEPVLELATRDAASVGLSANKSAYLLDIYRSENPGDSFTTDKDGVLVVNAKTIVSTERCETN